MQCLNNALILAKKVLVPLVLSGFAIFAPTKQLLIVTGVLIALDTISGMIASQKRGEKFSSKAFGNIVSKMVRYHLAILTGFLVEKYLIDNAVGISKIAAGWAGITELISLLENMDSISGKPIFAELIKKLTNRKDEL